MRKFLIVLCLVLPSIILFTQCEKSGSSGQVLYENHCGNCHMSDGTGIGNLYPDLNESSFIKDASLDIACFIRNGILASNEKSARFEQYNMPPNKILSNTDIANILNYLQKEFRSNPESYNFQEVKKKLNNCN